MNDDVKSFELTVKSADEGEVYWEKFEVTPLNHGEVKEIQINIKNNHYCERNNYEDDNVYFSFSLENARLLRDYLNSLKL